MSVSLNMPLLTEVGKAVDSILHLFPNPIHFDGETKGQSYERQKTTIAQLRNQAQEADRLAEVHKVAGKSRLASALFEWAQAMRHSASSTERHISAPDYQEWLAEVE